MASEGKDYAKVKAWFDAHPDVEFLRWQWIDFSAVVRCRMTSVRQALRLAKSGNSISVASPAANGFMLDGQFNEIAPGKKDTLVADWPTLLPCYYAPRHAVVMCFIDEPDQNFATCPRSALKRIEAEMKEKHDMSFLVGAEIEFYLTPDRDATEPIRDIDSYCSTASYRGPAMPVLEDAVAWMEKAGVPVWTFHTELVAGLYEMQTEPMSPLAVCDAVVYMTESIKAAASKHGLHATMHPKPFDKTHSVGQHLHISLSRQTDKDDSFLAGILPSVPAISAITMPNYDSYLRRWFTGGEWVAWDLENRLAAIRKIKRGYWEFRFLDCTANNYLGLAAILGVGMAGWERGDPLTQKPLGGIDGGTVTAELRKELGMSIPAPRDLREATQALSKDEAVKKVLGTEIVDRFARYKVNEEAMLADLTIGERRRKCVPIF